MVGDQTLTGRNKTLANYKKNNKKVYLFESYKDNVGGDISCGGSVNCDEIRGNVNAGGSINR